MMHLQLHCQNTLQFIQELSELLAVQALALPDIKTSILQQYSHSPQKSSLTPADNGGTSIMLNFPAIQQTQQEALLTAIAALPSVNRVQYQPASQLTPFSQIIATGEKMRQVLAQAEKVAQSNAPLLIIGDTGTGKDLLAYACHQASPRAEKPYLAINCAAMPEDVVESELFGHTPGAYPNALEATKGVFEQADGGAVFLDEIGEMSPRMQVKLLRFLSDGSFRRVGEDHEMRVDIRMICATQKNLESLVHQGLFREDLYYRLNVLTLELPPLRDRPQDIIPLANYFIALFAAEQHIPCPSLSPELHQLLTGYHWPGNVRQLKNTLYRALTQFAGTELQTQNIILPEFINKATAVSGKMINIDDEVLSGSLNDIIRRFESRVLTHLYQHYPSTRKLAQRLNVSHTAIANKLREYGINQQKQR